MSTTIPNDSIGIVYKKDGKQYGACVSFLDKDWDVTIHAVMKECIEKLKQ